jgi:hypothetical protein
MTGPVLLTYFNDLAKSAHKTGDSRSYVEHTLTFFRVKDFDSRLSDKLSRRLIAAEDRYRDNIAPFSTETNVAAAFNALRSSLANSTDYPTVKAIDVDKIRRFWSRYSPDLFRLNNTNYSPIEAILLLFVIAQNDGNIYFEDIETESAVAQVTRSRVALVRVSKKSRSFIDSLISSPKGIFRPGIKKRIEIVLQQLNI